MPGKLLTASLLAASLGTAVAQVAPSLSLSPVADAAMEADHETVKSLLREGADVNAAQGDGATALHWAAVKNDVALAEVLLYAGANVRATTRLGAYTPLVMAAKNGSARIVELLLDAGAEPDASTATGATPLMFAAASGSRDAVRLLVERGADVNAKEASRDETPLIFAATENRAEVIDLLVEHGADVELSTRSIDTPALDEAATEAFRARLRKLREEQAKAAKASEGEGESEARKSAEEARAESGGNFFSKLFGWMRQGKPGKEEAKREPERPRFRRQSFGERVGMQGGMTPLLMAARQGHIESVKSLLAAGADVNGLSESHTSPLLIATMNGHYDVASYLLTRGADPNLANEPAKVTPLYATINNWYAPKTSWPQPTAQKQQKRTHVELMKELLDKGADPNARLEGKIWFSAYNFDQSGLDETGATPFWRAAYGSDVPAMKLLVAYGADPSVATKKPPERPSVADEQAREVQDISGLPPVPVGGPAVAPLHAASGAGYGEGFAANEHRNHPAGFLPAVKYLVEVCEADVNVRDHEGNTPLHNAAARGDVAMIEYLVARGADVTAVNRSGQTTADMANGPVQRIQPFPEALALLTSLGAVNNDKCVSC